MTALARTAVQKTAGWISIREASELIGVSVATLRRWCDAGHVPVFTTPGGHRRFLRETVVSLLPAGVEKQSTTTDRGTAATIVNSYRHLTRRAIDLPERFAAIGASERAQLRRHGRHMVGVLVDALETAAPDMPTLDPRAQTAAAACGRLAAQSGLTLSETLAIFVHFRAPFLHGLGIACRQRGLDGAAATALLERASDIVDRLLPAVVTGYEAAADIGRQPGGTAS